MGAMETSDIDPAELAALLRNVDHVMRGAQDALVAFARDDAGQVGRQYERLQWARKEVAVLLERLPPEPPLSPEREAQLGRVIGAVLNKRFGDGSEAEVTKALDAAWPA